MLDIAILIPARLDSKRLKNKVILKINGLEMIEHVRRRALLNSYGVPVYVVSGDKKILNLVQNYGGLTIKTRKNHPNGFSRVMEAEKKLPFQRFILLQGDEILVDPKDLDLFIESIKTNSNAVYNAVSNIENYSEILNPNVVKCIISKRNRILLMFRKTPSVSSKNQQVKQLHKVCGLMGFTKKTIEKIGAYKVSLNSTLESIEQLTFLDIDIELKSIKITKNYPSINEKKDIEKCQKFIKNNVRQKFIWNKIAG